MSSSVNLMFCELTVAIDIRYWERLRDLKINTWRLDEVDAPSGELFRYSTLLIAALALTV